MKNGRAIISGILVVMFLIVGIIPVTTASADVETDYVAMVEEIGAFFNKALVLYKEGNQAEAKQNAQAAYFEVFENMEGPIRINISVRKNFELEEEFVGIRNMIRDGESAALIEKRINELMADLKSTAGELEGGFELVAEAGDHSTGTLSQPARNKQPAAHSEPVWQKTVDGIRERLEQALETYKKGDAESASSLVLNAQFDGYKNTLLETAVRRYVSQGRDYENNHGFSELIGMIRSGEKPDRLALNISALMSELTKDLPGLPAMGGAASISDSGKIAPNGKENKDWAGVNETLFREIEKAIALYEKGNRAGAATLVQDAYFDVFEGSGMEAKIGAKDPAFMSRLEGHFSSIVAHMKKGVSSEDMLQNLSVMKADFRAAAAMLGKESDSPWTMFLYSLMIILREGFEAILIISAIVAYLVKTDHADKLRVIYNGCISALALSVLTAVLVKWVFKVSAASQELLEGSTMILAAVVLFSVSYWLISKVEAQKWTSYIKGRVSDSLSSGSLRALWFVAFLAVYREGAETVLFYQALASDASGTGITWMSAGFAAGCALLAVVYLVMKFGAVRLPIRPFFVGTGTLLYYMAFVFTGKGIMELIEGRLIEPSMVSWMPTISFIGVYPYWQTVMPQVFLVIAALSALVFMMRQRGAACHALSPEKR